MKKNEETRTMAVKDGNLRVKDTGELGPVDKKIWGYRDSIIWKCW